jgi:preprotein translocase SecE subunit
MPLLDLYAPDKARVSRWIIGLSAGALVTYGGWSLFYALPQGMRGAIAGLAPFGSQYPVSWALVLGLVVLVGGLGGLWWGINHPKLVDFLQDCEGEMGKVSWASRSEVASSSAVVVVATAILAGWVSLADLALLGVRRLLGG